MQQTLPVLISEIDFRMFSILFGSAWATYLTNCYDDMIALRSVIIVLLCQHFVKADNHEPVSLVEKLACSNEKYKLYQCSKRHLSTTRFSPPS